MSELERRRKESERKGNPYLYFSLGVGFVIAAVLLIITANTAAAGLPFVIAAAALLDKGLSDVRGQQSVVEPPVSKERELLSAIKANSGSITPAEAAMETSFTVSEADSMLSELAGKGHLVVKQGRSPVVLAARQTRPRARRPVRALREPPLHANLPYLQTPRTFSFLRRGRHPRF